MSVKALVFVTWDSDVIYSFSLACLTDKYESYGFLYLF